MVDTGSIGQAQAGKAIEAVPNKPNQVKKAAQAPSTSRIEPIPLNNENSSGTSSISAPAIESTINELNNTPGAFSRIVGEINSNLKVINADLAIEVDRELKQVIFKVIDLETGETIKQIPSKELIRIAKKLKLMIENYSNKSTNSTQLFMDSASFV